MNFLYGLFGNYAVAIFFFALAVKIVLLPLGIQQQNSQIKMAKIKPKEQAIRGKYAGRTDSATQQKVQQEVLDMYKTENYSPMAGCLPLLVQMPILIGLYQIIRNPLTYISRFSPEVIENIQKFIIERKDMFVKLDALGNQMADDKGNLIYAIKNLGTMTVENLKNFQQISIIEIFNNPNWLAAIRTEVAGIPDTFKNIDFKFFGQMLTTPPIEAMLSILILIPIINLVASFVQMRLNKILNPAMAANEAANNKGMKIMEYTMPLFIVWMAFQMEAALGLYWIFQSVLGIGQMFVLAKIKPIPKISEEEYELARQQYGVIKKKKKKPAAEIEAELESESEEDDGENSKKKDEKYISKNIPAGISPEVKSNYQKTGKKYKINKRKK